MSNETHTYEIHLTVPVELPDDPSELEEALCLAVADVLGDYPAEIPYRYNATVVAKVAERR